MKTVEEIRTYVELQIIESTKQFKYHRKIQKQFDEDSEFYKEHRSYMLEYKEQIDTLKKVIDYITENEATFFVIYTSISD
jgi:hypothetical protein